MKFLVGKKGENLKISKNKQKKKSKWKTLDWLLGWTLGITYVMVKKVTSTNRFRNNSLAYFVLIKFIWLLVSVGLWSWWSVALTFVLLTQSLPELSRVWSSHVNKYDNTISWIPHVITGTLRARVATDQEFCFWWFKMGFIFVQNLT